MIFVDIDYQVHHTFIHFSFTVPKLTVLMEREIETRKAEPLDAEEGQE